MARSKKSASKESKPAKKAAKKKPAKKAAKKKPAKKAKRSTRKGTVKGDILNPAHKDLPDYIRAGYEKAGKRLEDVPYPWANKNHK